MRVVDGALDALITVDSARRIVDMNPACEAMFGYACSEVTGQDMNELIVPPETRDVQRKAFDRAVQDGELKLLGASVARFEGLRRDGSTFPLELSLSQTSDDPVQISAWIHDRTREERTERQASVAERVEGVVGIGSFEWNTRTDEVLWSDGLFRMFGHEPGEINPSVDQVISQTHPDDRERVRRYIAEMMEVGSTAPYEKRIIKEGGEVAYLYVSLAAEDGMIYGSVLDMTAQRDAEQRANFLTAIVEWTAAASDLALREAVDLLLELALPVSLGAAASVWVPRDGLLRCIATHSVGSLDSTGLDDACGEVDLPQGAGLPGRAWANGGIAILRPGDSNDHVRQRAMDAAGLSGGIAFSATGPAGTIAVAEILYREMTDVSEQGLLTLRACGVLIGEFLSHRRGELETTSLTKRELEILQLASEGLTGPKIAEHLVISPATVKSHFEHIYPKLSVTDRSAAVAEAFRLGLIR